MRKYLYEDIFSLTVEKIEKMGKIAGIKDNILKQLIFPERVLEVFIPIKMDNGKTRVFCGFRSQFNRSRGPFKGGVRFHPNVTKEEVMALSAWMALKTAVVGIPLGGGKGGVVVDPEKLSDRELEELSRGYTRAVFGFIGRDLDIPAPDVNTNPRIMGWILDEYEKISGQSAPGVVTGKPVFLGGSKTRDYSTAQGGFYVLQKAVEKMGIKKDATVAIQGFGNAGYNMAKIAHRAGYKIIAVSDSRGTAVNCMGMDPEAVMEHKKKTGSVSGYRGGEDVGKMHCFEQDADVLIPAALENSVTEKNAGVIKAKIILELANGPLTAEADEILSKKGVLVVPDVLANAGGVTVSYFEQVQNAYGYYWEEEDILDKLEKIMTKSFFDVWDTKEKHKTTMRNGAYILALKRLEEAMEARGRG